MKRTMIIALTTAVVVTVVVLIIGRWVVQQHGSGAAATPSDPALEEAHPSFLYGRVTTIAGATHEGRLRFGGNQEAFWGDYFNGVKEENPWAVHVPADRLPKQRSNVGFLGFEFGSRERQIDLNRPFMVRFGDIARIEAHNHDVRVTLKGGTTSKLNRLNASDFDDGLRVWDATEGVVNLDTKWIRRIELLPSPERDAAPHRLYGIVRTRHGADFTGSLQWDRQESLGRDLLRGRAGDRVLSLRFDTIRSISRHSDQEVRVTLTDGRELVLSATADAGRAHRGIYVDDSRYGRVLISWDAFDRLELTAPGTGSYDSGPAYDDFPAGRALTGSVTTGDGRRLTGRLVYDLDESETIETLDAPFEGVDYTLPFGLVASIAPLEGEQDGQTSLVTLHSGEELQLERSGDLSDGNAGMLIFVEGADRPEYVSWPEVRQVDFDRPPAMYPPID